MREVLGDIQYLLMIIKSCQRDDKLTLKKMEMWATGANPLLNPKRIRLSTSTAVTGPPRKRKRMAVTTRQCTKEQRVEKEVFTELFDSVCYASSSTYSMLFYDAIQCAALILTRIADLGLWCNE